MGETAEAAALVAAARRDRALRRLELVHAIDAPRARALGEIDRASLEIDRASAERMGRRGGVKGAEGLVTALKWGRCGALIDASHPFDAPLRAAAAGAARVLGLPFLQYHRPLWTAQSDRVRHSANAASAARSAPFFARVFLWVGLERLGPFAERRDLWHLVRAYDPPPGRLPVARGDYTLGRGPFTERHEATLLSDYRISLLVLENSGAALAAPMRRAAAALDLPISLISPPDPPSPGPSGAVARSEAEALAWLRALH
ncbi:MAG: precorrin-6A/cobalt-precorrin-6A reductase [Pseudomonadota bacterium]